MDALASMLSPGPSASFAKVTHSPSALKSASQRTVQLAVGGMMCGAVRGQSPSLRLTAQCVKSIEDGLAAEKGILSVTVALLAERACFDSARLLMLQAQWSSTMARGRRSG